MSIGSKLKALRILKGLTQEELADAVEVTRQTIISLENGRYNASLLLAHKIAKYFGIKCYDKELLEHAANDSGICKELFENHDEKPTNSFLYSLVMDSYSFGYPSSSYSALQM